MRAVGSTPSLTGMTLPADPPASALAPSPADPRPGRLVGVYRAEGSLRGEIAYVMGKLLGRAHCSLCDITHSPVRRKAAWDRMVERLGVPFELVHLDELDAPTAGIVHGWDDAPAVLVELDGVLSVLLDADALEPLGGDVDAFEAAVRAALGARSVRLP